MTAPGLAAQRRARAGPAYFKQTLQREDVQQRLRANVFRRICLSEPLEAGPVYVAHMRSPCSGLGGAGPNALVTRQVGASGLCSGDIATVQDTMAHITVGSCSFGEFVPYTRPGA